MPPVFYRDFILSLIDRAEPFHEAIMNLPQNATDFLDVFIGLARRAPTAPNALAAPATTATNSTEAVAAAAKPNPFADPSQPLPRIHVYAFSTSEVNEIVCAPYQHLSTCPSSVLTVSCLFLPPCCGRTR